MLRHKGVIVACPIAKTLMDMCYVQSRHRYPHDGSGETEEADAKVLARRRAEADRLLAFSQAARDRMRVLFMCAHRVVAVSALAQTGQSH